LARDIAFLLKRLLRGEKAAAKALIDPQIANLCQGINL
jgi:hypothetical protein